jgi:flagellar protein FliO/FliZ
MENIDYLRFVGALGLVVGLILMVTWGIRRFAPQSLGVGASMRRLGVIESLSLDAKHRLVLIRRDDREYLLLLGGASSVIESLIDSGPTREDTT